MTKQEFIKMIVPLAQKEQKETGILASITIAQAILESGWGTSDLALHANNYFGMKTSLSGNTWESVWDGKSIYTKSSPEQDSSGNESMKVSDFRVYPAIADSVRDHSLYLTGAKKEGALRFQGLAGEKDYQKAAQIIRNGGYATDIRYVQKVCNIIEEYGLTSFDKEEKTLNITDRIAKSNPCYKAGTIIVPGGGMIHSVGCPQPDPEVFASIWNSESAKVCVHAVVGKDGSVLQLLPFNVKGWHCGSGKKGSGNNTLISLEMTEPATIKYTGGSNWIELGDGSGTKAHVLSTYRQAVEFFAYIAAKYGFNPLDSNCLMSHHEGNQKGIASNHGDVEHIWNKFGLSMDQFRRDVKKTMEGGKIEFGTVTETNTGSQKVNPLAGTVAVSYAGDDGLNIRREPGYGDNVERIARKGEFFTVVGISADERWYKLSNDLFITTIPDYVAFKATEAQKVETGDGKYFRVRTSWCGGEQIGAFKNKENAVELCRQNAGYKVFDDTGKEIYPCVEVASTEFKVQVSITDLRIRKGPGTTYDYQKKDGKALHTGKGTFTIVKTSDGPGARLWGLLKSYEKEVNGWISLDYAEQI